MDFFSRVDDGYVQTRAKGVYRQAPMFERAGQVYVRFGSGFLRLIYGGATSHPDVKWIDMDGGGRHITETVKGIEIAAQPVRTAAE